MFKKILIANRGEIACRIIKTARRMGIQTVAVYSDADAAALHVGMADEAIRIGPAASAESYLVAERIVEAARSSGAEAVHPGYGFLAENSAFVEALVGAGISFIGPEPHAIALMGDKIESKRLAEQAGVDTVPGHLAVLKNSEDAVRAAGAIGYPVMIKASAGGGGKGMRMAQNEAEVREGFSSASNEARSSFGDDRVFIEKFIEQPRHIEIQILADRHGNCIHLGERECSIQRRHQKVIEEAPSPFVDAELRNAMGAQAVALARAVDYCSAGTVEFIVDPDGKFYFLEMNTRLQVEHPVTEMITGLDLVEEMLRIAAGEVMSRRQDEVQFQGWAIECRIYAEDPARGFVPSVGRLVRCRPPAESACLRIDTGVGEGAEISMFYDPMIAKLSAHGDDRAAAVETMAQGLDGYYIRGINHNISFLSAVVASERFREGRLTTAFIAEEFGESFVAPKMPAPVLNVFLGVAATVQLGRRARELAIAARLGAPASEPSDWAVMIGDESCQITVARTDTGLDVVADGRRIAVGGAWRYGESLFSGQIDGRPVIVQIERDGIAFKMRHGGFDVRVLVLRPRAAELQALMPVKQPADVAKLLLSPMSGLVVAVHVDAGAEVKAGQPLAVIEAMKMENVLRAERDGVVAEVMVAPGESLVAEQTIMEFAG